MRSSALPSWGVETVMLTSRPVRAYASAKVRSPRSRRMLDRNSAESTITPSDAKRPNIAPAVGKMRSPAFWTTSAPRKPKSSWSGTHARTPAMMDPPCHAAGYSCGPRVGRLWCLAEGWRAVRCAAARRCHKFHLLRVCEHMASPVRWMRGPRFGLGGGYGGAGDERREKTLGDQLPQEADVVPATRQARGGRRW